MIERRREVVGPRTAPISIRVRPDPSLSDGVVSLRLPQRDDIRLLARWASPDMLEGVWISGQGPADIADAAQWARTVVTDLLDGWTEDGSVHGPALVIDETEPFVGLLYFSERSSESVELAYGVAPPFRRRGIATRAARVASDWLLAAGPYERVELWIAESHPERCVVAERAGFRLHEQVETYHTGAKRSYFDVVYVRP